MMSIRIWTCVSAVAVVLAACESARDTNVIVGDAGVDETVDDAATPGTCAAWADAFCKLWSGCATWRFTAMFGDLAKCTRVEGLACEDFRRAPGVTNLSLISDGCADALSNLDCNAFVLAVVYQTGPPECVPSPGSLPNGSPCAYREQCESGVCTAPQVGQGWCGVCDEGAPEGSDCAAQDCAWGLTCARTSTQPLRCVKGAGLGESCSDATPCSEQYLCIIGVCAVPPLGEQGYPCDLQNLPGGRVCDFAANGFTCDGAFEQCAFVGQPLALGASCTFISDLPCGYASSCYHSICVALADEGEACDEAEGLFCLPQESCIAGRCAVNDATKCGVDD